MPYPSSALPNTWPDYSFGSLVSSRGEERRGEERRGEERRGEQSRARQRRVEGSRLTWAVMACTCRP
eukprot:1725471-Rhodomonas_salina.1